MLEGLGDLIGAVLVIIGVSFLGHIIYTCAVIDTEIQEKRDKDAFKVFQQLHPQINITREEWLNYINTTKKQ